MRHGSLLSANCVAVLVEERRDGLLSAYFVVLVEERRGGLLPAYCVVLVEERRAVCCLTLSYGYKCY